MNIAQIIKTFNKILTEEPNQKIGIQKCFEFLESDPKIKKRFFAYRDKEDPMADALKYFRKTRIKIRAEKSAARRAEVKRMMEAEGYE